MEEEKKIKTNNEHELDVIEFWKKNQIFEKSLEKDSPNGEFVFYDGPPTANGRPGIHHLEARAFKDAIPRYKTMQGYHVRRKGGWDTHGLPVELQVEKALGLTNKKQIEEYGIAKFNQECKQSVWTYIDEWEKFTDRIGYWVDHKNPYVTYHNSYIESLWDVVKEINKKDILYKDDRIVPWCSRCGTALSSHELAQGYKDVKDLSVTAKFKVVGVDNTFILAWTTTPWTLPGNVALAVNEKLTYVKIQAGEERFILGKDRLSIIQGEFNIIEEFTGDKLIGLEYEPLYSYFAEQFKVQQKLNPTTNMGDIEKAYRVYAADFVTANDGTGIVHTAVMYGQDDFVLGTKLGLPKYHLVNLDGTFKDGMDFLSNRLVKSIAENGEDTVAIDIIKDLAHKGLLFKKEKYEHSYPHCWRCQTPLIYYARDSWYIRMSDLREDLIMNNNFINWEPKHVSQGRFGEWISEVKDWAISRERYWGTPLPIWEDTNGVRHIFTNKAELIKSSKNSGNNYTMIRHGEAQSNLTKTCSFANGNIIDLTETGVEQIKTAASELKDKKFDLIYTSPFLRTRHTAEIIADQLGIPHVNIITDDRLVDLNTGIFEGKTWPEYFDFFSDKDRYNVPSPGGESVLDVKRRIGDFVYEIEKNTNGKNILIVAHGISLWMLECVAKGADIPGMKKIREDLNHDIHQDSLPNGAHKELNFVPMPHNLDYEYDLHRPFIDEFPVFNEAGEKLTRVSEVMDVWFDSGAMPYAQDGYPNLTDNIHFPADYICEGMDQTRGWFYTLHAVSALLGRGPAYKNVICLGLILDKEGQKMSKSRGNVTSPWEMCEKYGADALRFWMYSVNQPGDSKNFDEKTVDEVVKKVFNLIRNVYAFYDLYRNRDSEKTYEENTLSKNVLDKWILAKLSNLITNTTNSLDAYSLLNPTRDIRSFIDDLSTWYLRRSRDRMRELDPQALQTIYIVLKNLAKLIAPFAPFIAEELWLDLKNEKDEQSVHLSNWPKSINIPENEMLLESMEMVRDLCTGGHALRKSVNIPVRQPLLSFTIDKEIDEELQDLIREELNVRNIVISNKIALNTEITDELKDEGNFREFVRFLQDNRKSQGLNAGQVVDIKIKSNHDAFEFINRWQEQIKKEVSINEIITDNSLNSEILKIENMEFAIMFV